MGNGHQGKRRIKPTEIPHLYRVHYSEEDQIGYLVRLNRARKKIEELFSFSKYPNQRTCFQAARNRAREVTKLYPRLTRREYAQIRRSDFQNSEIGVRKLTKTVKGHKYEFWEASWSPCVGMVKKKRFSIHKYGDEEAHKQARVARAEGLLAMSSREREKQNHRHHHSHPHRQRSHHKPESESGEK